jgi:hypothetical protein
MSRLLPAALAVAALLLGTIVWELQDAAGPGLPSGRSSAAPVARAASGADTSDVLQGWMATALGRPLFRQDRRPPKGADEVARGGNEPLRLTGVITGPFGNRAIFRSGENAKPIVAEEKAQLNGFMVRLIEPGKAVVVETDGNVRTLKPSFGTHEQTTRSAPWDLSSYTIRPKD